MNHLDDQHIYSRSLGCTTSCVLGLQELRVCCAAIRGAKQRSSEKRIEVVGLQVFICFRTHARNSLGQERAELYNLYESSQQEVAPQQLHHIATRNLGRKSVRNTRSASIRALNTSMGRMCCSALEATYPM